MIQLQEKFKFCENNFMNEIEYPKMNLLLCDLSFIQLHIVIAYIQYTLLLFIASYINI